MSRLSVNNLPEHIRSFEYDRQAVTSGILHFGTGNFHRAHQAVYCDDLLNIGETNWGITGVSLRSPSMRDALEPQDYIYTLATLGKSTEYRIIGAIKNIVVGPEDPIAVIDLVAHHSTKLISSTITEKGYYLSSGRIDFDHPDLQSEFASLDMPKTIYGFLARGLIQRAHRGRENSGLTIMCCDNISKGGEHLKDGVSSLLHKHSSPTLDWAQTHVGFISSMVDRVCPATNQDLRTSVLRETGREDARPVSAEPYTQWVIEDGFLGDRPHFDEVGAIFVDDITPFEQMKLRYLNAAHTMAASLGYLSGDMFVHEALRRSEVLKFVRQALRENVLPHATVPYGLSGEDYIEAVVERFQNENLPYANLQVGTDSSQKIQQRLFPTIDIAMTKNTEIPYFAFCLGAWVIFIQKALLAGVLNDPKTDMFAKVDTDDMEQRAAAYLSIASAEQFAFYRQSDFMQTVVQHAKNIQAIGIKTALTAFLQLQEQKEDSHA